MPSTDLLSTDAAVLPTSSTIALTTTRKFTDVTGPENLPPSVARQMAEIVATYRVTGSDFARDVARLGVGTAAFVAVMLAFFSAASAVGAVIGGVMALPLVWQKGPLTRVQEHLKELGIGFTARRKLMRKLAAIVGNLPARDPAQRPAVDEIVALLAPGGIDPWAPSTPVVPRVLITTSSIDATLASSVVAYSLDRAHRERRLVMMMAVTGVGMGALTVFRGAPWWIAAVFIGCVTLGTALGLSLGRLMNRRGLNRLLATLGVAAAEQDRVIVALKPLLQRKQVKAIAPQQRREVLTAQLVQALTTSTPALPAADDAEVEVER